MSRRLRDLAGQKFGRLTVLSRAPSDGGRRARWLCACSCGKRTTVVGQSLVDGGCRSCGCLRAELSAKRMSGTRKSGRSQEGVTRIVDAVFSGDALARFMGRR